jgi:hypothetical protein
MNTISSHKLNGDIEFKNKWVVVKLFELNKEEMLQIRVAKLNDIIPAFSLGSIS